MNPLLPTFSSGEGQPSPHINEDKHLSACESKTHEISKKIVLSQDVQNPKIKKITYQKILQKHKESDEVDIHDETIEKLNTSLDKFMRPLSKDSLFYDTDLIIIDETFTGTLPLNGIKQSELNRTELLFKNICDGKEIIKIMNASDHDTFKNTTENMIKKLLTRNIGRKLIQKVIENTFITKLKIIPGAECLHRTMLDRNEVVITLGDKPPIKAYHPSGNFIPQDIPLFLALAHELIHASHLPRMDERFSAPTFSPEYDNLEEQLTITGLKEDLALEHDPTLDYDELNEWNITAAFTNTQNIYYPRFSAQFFKSSPSQLTENERIQQKNIVSLVARGEIKKLEKIYEQDATTVSKLFVNGSSLILTAVLSGNADMLGFLIEKGIDPKVPSSNLNPLAYIFTNNNSRKLLKYDDTIKLLLANKVSISSSVLNELLSSSNLEVLSKEKYIPLMQLIFSHFMEQDDLSEFLLNQQSNPCIDLENLGTIILNCSFETLKDFLAEGHSLKEWVQQYNQSNDIAYALSVLGFDTTILDSTLTTIHDRLKPHL